MTLLCTTQRGGLAPWYDLPAWETPVRRFFGETPAVDVRETDEAYTIDVELPGVPKEGIQIEAEGNVLTVTGERKREESKTEGIYHRVERWSGEFRRSFKVPDGFDTDKVGANLANGVLRVTLPKREEAKPKKIQVAVN
jgi:HSP20 family protein